MKKTVLFFSLLLFFIPLLSAKQTQVLEPVSLQLKWKTQFQFAGYYAALEKGFYQQEGLDVSILPLNSNKNIIDEVATGKINYAVGGSGILAHYANGKPIIALAAIFQHDALVFIAKASSGIISPYEMAGKRIMFDGTTEDDAPLTAMLNDADLSKQDYIEVPPSFRSDELINDQTDIMSAYLTDQPFTLKSQGIKLNIINPQNYGFDFYGDILYTSQIELKNHAQRADRFKRASLKGWQYALSNPEELIYLLKNKYHSQSSIETLRYEAKETRKLILPDVIPLGEINVNRLRRVANTYASLNLAPPLSDINLKKFIHSDTGTSPIILSTKEKAWLKKHPIIRVGIGRDFAPYEWVDKKGNYVGLAADYMRLLEERLGVKFEIIKNKSWPEILKLAKNGEIDLVSCLNKSPQRQEYLNFTKAYISNPRVIINANRNGYIGSLKKLRGKTVAVEKGYLTYDRLSTNYPKIKLLLVDTTSEALKKVSTGEVDAYVGDAAFADYSIKKSGLLNLQFAGETGNFSRYRAGVIKSHPELLSILHKAFNNITRQERQSIEKKWMGLTVQTGVTSRTLLAISLVISAIFLTFIFRGYHLKRSKKIIANSEKQLQSILDASPVPQAINDSDLNVTYLNQAFVHTFGYTLEDIPTLAEWWPKAYPDPYYRESIQQLWRHNQQMYDKYQHKFEPTEVEVHCKDGSMRHIVIDVTMIQKSDIESKNLRVITLFDITERKLREEKLHQNQQKLIQNKEVLINISKKPYSSKIEAFDNIIKITAEQLQIPRISIWLFNTNKSQLICQSIYSRGVLSHDELVLETKDYPGYFKSLEASGSILVDDVLTHPATKECIESYLKPLGITSLMDQSIRIQGKIVGVICYEQIGSQRDWLIEEQDFAQAITDLCSQVILEIERRQTEDQLKLSARVFSDTHEGIMITDTNSMIIDVNPAFCHITGYSREEIIGKNPKILSSGKQSPQFYAEMWHIINDHGYWQGEIWNRTKSGVLYAESLNISALTNDNHEVINYVGMFTDVTQSKKQQEELTLMAHYDRLTGLPNRSLFVDRFHQAIAHSKRAKTQLAVCFLDLDKFKPINDNYGHEVGDQILIEVANRINLCIREEDTVSRQGGDEFALLLNDIKSNIQCEQTLQRLHQSLAVPYLINNVKHSISASSGFTLYPSDMGDIDTLLRHADQAMYQSKRLGRNQFHLFNATQDQEIIYKHHRLTEIEQALLNDELTLYYQPKVNMVTGEVFGAEALIRWIHPEKGIIPPLDFLPLIDSTQLEIKIGNWVISQALAQLDTWQKQGIILEVSINIASYHLQSSHFITNLENELAQHLSVKSEFLQLEILESSALGDVQTIQKIISTCQNALGVNIALDDFGTGYSSLTHLRSLSANTIKIDQSFVRDVLDDPSDYSIIEGIIGLANAFNRTVIAEGVETTEHGLLLLMLDCHLAQGYGIAKPMPANEVEAWLNHYTPNTEWQRYGNKLQSAKESKAFSFQLVANQWKNKLLNNIQAEPDAIDSWPIMKSTRCHCAHWIKREKIEQLFAKEILIQLEQTHTELHAQAHTLQDLYLKGDIQAARAGIDELKANFKTMTDMVSH